MSSHTSLLCRLCLDICMDFKKLYGDSGQPNETHDIAIKYFHPMFLTVDHENGNTVICLKCWRHITEFHSYQQAVFQAQKSLLAGESHVEFPTGTSSGNLNTEVSVKTENDEDIISLPDLELMEEYCYDEFFPKEDNKEATIKEPACKEPNNNKEKKPIHVGDNCIRNDVKTSLIEPASMVKAILNDEEQKVIDLNHKNLANTSYTIGNQLKRPLKLKRRTTSDYDSISRNVDGTSPVDSYQTANVAKRMKKTIVEIDFYISTWRPHLDCELCGAQFPCFGTLQQHFRRVHPIDECFITCCNRKFNTRSKIESHARYHTDPKAFQCDKCHCKLSSEASLYTHSRRCQPERFTHIHKKTPLDEIDNFISLYMPSLNCELCHQSYARFTNLKNHFKYIHPGKEFHVMCCQKKFMGRSQYKEHIWLHMDPNAFKCKLCGKFHGRYISLQMHMERHHAMQLKPLRPSEIINDLKINLNATF